MAAWAALLAQAQRSALLEVIGPPLADAVTTLLSGVTDPAEQAILPELSGDLNLRQGDVEAGMAHYNFCRSPRRQLETQVMLCAGRPPYCSRRVRRLLDLGVFSGTLVEPHSFRDICNRLRHFVIQVNVR